jgi:hypothetical protein
LHTIVKTLNAKVRSYDVEIIRLRRERVPQLNDTFSKKVNVQVDSTMMRRLVVSVALMEDNQFEREIVELKVFIHHSFLRLIIRLSLTELQKQAKAIWQQRCFNQCYF